MIYQINGLDRWAREMGNQTCRGQNKRTRGIICVFAQKKKKTPFGNFL